MIAKLGIGSAMINNVHNTVSNTRQQDSTETTVLKNSQISRVDEIKNQIKSGNYQINMSNTARRMAEELS